MIKEIQVAGTWRENRKPGKQSFVNPDYKATAKKIMFGEAEKRLQILIQKHLTEAAQSESLEVFKRNLQK